MKDIVDEIERLTARMTEARSRNADEWIVRSWESQIAAAHVRLDVTRQIEEERRRRELALAEQERHRREQWQSARDAELQHRARLKEYARRRDDLLGRSLRVLERIPLLDALDEEYWEDLIKSDLLKPRTIDLTPRRFSHVRRQMGAAWYKKYGL